MCKSEWAPLSLKKITISLFSYTSGTEEGAERVPEYPQGSDSIGSLNITLIE